MRLTLEPKRLTHLCINPSTDFPFNFTVFKNGFLLGAVVVDAARQASDLPVVVSAATSVAVKWLRVCRVDPQFEHGCLGFR